MTVEFSCWTSTNILRWVKPFHFWGLWISTKMSYPIGPYEQNIIFENKNNCWHFHEPRKTTLVELGTLCLAVGIPQRWNVVLTLKIIVKIAFCIGAMICPTGYHCSTFSWNCKKKKNKSVFLKTYLIDVIALAYELDVYCNSKLFSFKFKKM